MEVIAECAAAFREIGATDIAEALQEIVLAAPLRRESSLSRADTLLKNLAGYDYEAIRTAVERRLNP